MGGVCEPGNAIFSAGGEGGNRPAKDPGRPDIGSRSSAVVVAGVKSSGSQVRSTAISLRDIVPFPR